MIYNLEISCNLYFTNEDMYKIYVRDSYLYFVYLSIACIYTRFIILSREYVIF